MRATFSRYWTRRGHFLQFGISRSRICRSSSGTPPPGKTAVLFMSELESIGRLLACLPFFAPRNIQVSPQDPDIPKQTPRISCSGRGQSKARPRKTKLASSQFGLRTNLVASQIETGLGCGCAENQSIE